MYALIAVAIYAVATLSMMAFLRGLAPENTWTHHAFQIGSMFEVLMWMRILAARTAFARETAMRVQMERDMLVLQRARLEDLVEVHTRDLSASKALAEEANLAKSAFLENMSHEMRTPMHAILSFTRLARDKVGLGEMPRDTVAGYLFRIDESGRRLLGLLNDLLDLSRLEADMMHYDFAQHDLKAIVAHVVGELEPIAHEKRVTLHDLTSGAPSVMLVCDQQRIEQVCRNLLANAIQFTRAEGEVRIAIETPTPAEGSIRPPASVSVIVSDDGVGIPEPEREAIFEKFVQSSRTRTGAGGSGLGLSIAKQIVSDHQGTLQVRASPSGGSEFVVTLPVQREQLVSARPATNPSENSTAP